MTRYKVHFPEQDVYVNATCEAEADFTARDDVEPDSIEEVEGCSDE
jgi:hypothetical protein